MIRLNQYRYLKILLYLDDFRSYGSFYYSKYSYKRCSWYPIIELNFSISLIRLMSYSYNFNNLLWE